MQGKESLRGDGIEVGAQMAELTSKKGRDALPQRQSRKVVSWLQIQIRLKLLGQYVQGSHKREPWLFSEDSTLH